MKLWPMVIVLVGVMGLGGCGGAATPTAAPPTDTPLPTATFTATSVPTNTSTQTATATATPTETPTATPTPTPALGSLKNPVPFGEQIIITVPDLGNVIGLRLTTVVRGAEAEKIINAGNEYVPEHPGIGKEFYAVYVEASHIDAKEGLEAFPFVSAVGWAAVVNGEVESAPVILMLNDQQLMSEGVLPGGMTEGWVPFKVPIGAKVSGIRFSMDPTKHNVWFSLGE